MTLAVPNDTPSNSNGTEPPATRRLREPSREPSCGLRERSPRTIAKLAGIVGGDPQPSSKTKRLALAQRAYDTALFATTAQLWVEAIEANRVLADDRRAQHRINAADSTALGRARYRNDDTA